MPGTVLNILDGNNNAKTLQVFDVGGNLIPAHVNVDPTTGNGASVTSGGALLTTPAANPTSGAGTPFFNDAVAGTVVQVKSSQGNFHFLDLLNTTAATAYLQIFFSPSASVTLGTTTPDHAIRLTANESKTIVLFVPFGATVAGGSAGTGLSIAGTTTVSGSTGAAISVGAIFA